MYAFITALLMFVQLVNPSKGNEAFEKGEYDKAISIYRQALEANPEENRLMFNIGNSLSKLGKAQESIETFEAFKKQVETPEEQAMADYNIGTLLAQQDPQKAIGAFQQALRNNPEDVDAKHNLELLLRQQQEQQQQNQQNQNQDQNQDENQEDQQQQQQDQNQNQQNQDQSSQQNQDSPADQQQDQQSQQQQPKLSPKEAEALLDALGQREKDLLKAMKKRPEEDSPKTDKDW